MEFWTVSTNVQTGEPNYHLLKDCSYTDLEWVRASASIPFFAHPVAIGGHFYFDGGVSNSIPLNFAEKHYDKNIVITTQPKSYRKKRDKLWPIEKVVLHNYPAVLEKIKTRSADYNACLNEIEDKENKGDIFVIRPTHSLNIGTMENDQSELRRVYQIGRKEAEQKLTLLEKYLNC